VALSRRARMTIWAVAGGFLLLVLVVLVFAFVMLRPARFTETLRSAARDAGLELTLTAPAHPTLWPRPGVKLEGLQIFVQGQSAPVLIVSQGAIVVPWRTLLGGPTAIRALQLDTPRLDLVQLRNAIAKLSSGTGKAPHLPRIDTGINIKNGTLVEGNTVLLSSVNVQTGPLLQGHRFTLILSARNHAGQLMGLRFGFKPMAATGHGIDLKNITLNARSGKNVRIELGGNAVWSGDARIALSLSGAMHVTPDHSYRLKLDASTANNSPPGQLHLVLEGPSSHVDMHLSPQALASWWRQVSASNASGSLPEPPLNGSIDAAELDLGGVRIKGLKLRAGAAVPAASASASKPAGKTK
jgi:uncharacterized protein involved in outer membrane biogenesis